MDWGTYAQIVISVFLVLFVYLIVHEVRKKDKDDG